MPWFPAMLQGEGRYPQIHRIHKEKEKKNQKKKEKGYCYYYFCIKDREL